MTPHTAIPLTPWAIAQILTPWVLLALSCAFIVGGVVCVIKLLDTAIWHGEVKGKEVLSAAAVAAAAPWMSTMIGDFVPSEAWWSQPLTTGWDTAYAIAMVALTVAQTLLTAVTAAAALVTTAVTVVWLSGRADGSGERRGLRAIRLGFAELRRRGGSRHAVSTSRDGGAR